MKAPFLSNLWLGSLTNVGNLPFRRLAVYFGAPATLSEMVISHYAARGGKQDLALMRHHPDEKCFGVQIVGAQVKELVKTAKLAQEAGAHFIDFNCACPHASVVNHGSGAFLLKSPAKIEERLLAILDAINLPLTLKIRKGFEKNDNNAEEIVDVAQKCGVSAVFIHARTREDLYRGSNDWELIERIAQNSDVPIIGCGDLAHGTEVLEKMQNSHCAGFALARGAATKPWIFREIAEGKLLDPSGAERLEMLKRLVQYTLENFGRDGRGLKNANLFLRKQLAFLTRYTPVGAIGRAVPMQERVDQWTPRDELEALWAEAEKNSEKMTELLRLAELPSEPEDSPRPCENAPDGE